MCSGENTLEMLLRCDFCHSIGVLTSGNGLILHAFAGSMPSFHGNTELLFNTRYKWDIFLVVVNLI